MLIFPLTTESQKRTMWQLSPMETQISANHAKQYTKTTRFRMKKNVDICFFNIKFKNIVSLLFYRHAKMTWKERPHFLERKSQSNTKEQKRNKVWGCKFRTFGILW